MFTEDAPQHLQELEDSIAVSLQEDARYDLHDITCDIVAGNREREEADPIPAMSELEIEARILHLCARREALRRELQARQEQRGPHGSAAIARFCLDQEAHELARGAA
jgi:hypothetical protein